MQGELNEIDIRSILQLIELGQRTGELFVEAYSSPRRSLSGDRPSRLSSIDSSWFVFFNNGEIVYAGENSGNLSRLQDYLRRYQLHTDLSDISVSSIATVNAPEYGHVWALLENHVLTPAQGRTIIQGMVHETLFDLLSLHQGAFIFEISSPLAPQLTTLKISPLVSTIIKQIQEWKQLHPHLKSPDYCPAIAHPAPLRGHLKESTFKALERWLDGKTSIRQMARYLNRDILTIAKALYPYIQQGIVQIYSPPNLSTDTQLSRLSSTPLPNTPKKVICVDDGATIRRGVEYILNYRGYQVATIGNPLDTFSLAFKTKPDLILCDIAMPEIDGYEICAMLRQSKAFRQTPIIMLTGKDGFIDRIKARIVGATDYLTKPFGEQELLTLVEKYIGQGDPNESHQSNQPSQLLAEALEDELKIDIPNTASTSSESYSEAS
jgi:twitching motility two-component system response regulator PilG